jgi:hypothetical protein
LVYGICNRIGMEMEEICKEMDDSKCPVSINYSRCSASNSKFSIQIQDNPTIRLMRLIYRPSPYLQLTCSLHALDFYMYILSKTMF